MSSGYLTFDIYSGSIEIVKKIRHQQMRILAHFRHLNLMVSGFRQIITTVALTGKFVVIEAFNIQIIGENTAPLFLAYHTGMVHIANGGLKSCASLITPGTG
jgi:hypothetical protein